jgi:hypothetical protein
MGRRTSVDDKEKILVPFVTQTKIPLFHVFFTLALVGGEWSDSRPGRFIPGEGAHDTQ